MSYRRKTIGVVLAIRLVEYDFPYSSLCNLLTCLLSRYAEDIRLSEAQIDHPSVQLCTRSIVDHVIL